MSPSKSARERSIDPVDLGIMWDRLLSIGDAILQAMIRTSFSVLVREVKDIGCAIVDARGRPIAFGADAVPGFNAAAQYSLAHMLRRFPPSTLQHGDVLATNDPWMGGGHRPDIAVTRPVFRAGKLIGYLMSYSHLPDIGGRALSVLARDVYEEGFAMPMVKLFKAGTRNDELFELIEANVRTPEQVLGDIMANVSGSAVGETLLEEFFEDYAVEDLQTVADGIVGQTERAMRASIREIPDGTYRNAIVGEAVGGDIELVCELRVAGDHIDVDFTGTALQVPFAINVTESNMKSSVVTTIKSLTTPAIPSNFGDTIPIHSYAPPGCILNAKHPAPTGGRHMTASYIPSLVMGALAAAIPDRVMAEVGMGTTFGALGTRRDGRPLATHYFTSGGLGAMSGRDGRQTAPYPVNSSVIASELWEAETGLAVLQRALLPDSGGAGQYRGGVGQIVDMRNDTGQPMTLSLFGVRTQRPASGLAGGKPGQLRRFEIDGAAVDPKGNHVLPPGAVLRIVEAGGGGFGDVAQRPPERVLADVVAGVVSIEGARRDYGVEVSVAANTARRIQTPRDE